MFWLLALSATLAILTTAVIYGTDVLTAVVSRPALAELDDRALVQITGRTHFYGDKRLPIAGVGSIVFSLTTIALALVAGSAGGAVLAGVALLVLLVWLSLFLRISVPINRTLIAAAHAGEVPADARALQDRWESIIVLRSVLQGVALVALVLALAVTVAGLA